jgi:hypothetical protein
MLLVIPTLFVVERAAEDGDLRTAAVAGALIGVLALVRTVGVFLLPAALLVLLVRRRWLAAGALLAAALVFIAPWQLWISAYQGETPAPLVGKYGAYGPWLAEGYRAGGFPFAKAVLAKNANELFGFLGYITLPVPPAGPRLASLAVVLGTLGIGAWTLRRRVPVTLLFLGIYVRADAVCPRVVAGALSALRCRRTSALDLASTGSDTARAARARGRRHHVRRGRLRDVQSARRPRQVVGQHPERRQLAREADRRMGGSIDEAG